MRLEPVRTAIGVGIFVVLAVSTDAAVCDPAGDRCQVVRRQVDDGSDQAQPGPPAPIRLPEPQVTTTSGAAAVPVTSGGVWR